MANTIESHVQIATGFDSAILLLCIVGLILNIGLLVIIYIRKQLRRSIYTTYMIQIAVTDAIVCVIWLAFVALQLANLPSRDELKEEFEEDEALLSNDAEVEEETSGIFQELRMFYAMYNFHFYNNIFLLAIMSVERCVAVMKSLRCQRYQFNKKFIYAASAAMWFLAFALALPTFIKPDLIVRSELDFEECPQAANLSTNQYVNISKLPISCAIYQCHKPLLRAQELNETAVTDCCGVTINDCIDLFISYGDQHNDVIEDVLQEFNDTELLELENLYSEEDYSEKDLYDYEYSAPDQPYYDDYALTHDVKNYEVLYKFTLHKVQVEVTVGDIDTCDPMLQYDGKIYQILANLILGFFFPFFAIVVSNVLIACVIRGRALSRLESDQVEEESMVGRRMSDFFRHFSRSEADSYRRGSPIAQRSGRYQKVERVQFHSHHDHTNGVDQNNRTSKSPSTAITFHPASPTRSANEQPIVKTRDSRVRLSSLSTQCRRTSGGSGSSAESFLTDMTSLQTSSSPGVRLSAPLFVQSQDGRTLIQRASSADNGGASAANSSRPSSVRRWSSEVFRRSGMVEEGKKLIPPEEKKTEEMGKTDTLRSDGNFDPLLPPRGRSESTQELLESQGRLHAPKQQKYNRTQSHQPNSRNRAYSGGSRVSGAGPGTSGTLPQRSHTVVYKHAVKQMRVSRTVLIYVIVFAFCWIPQRVVHFVYVTEGLVGKGGHFCNILTSTVRLVSFFSVLLNPIVYAVTQRELRHFLRRFFNEIFKFQKAIPKTKKSTTPRDENNDRQFSGTGIAMNHLSTEEASKIERHNRNRERWFRLVQRLGPRSAWHSITSGISTHNKPSDGTIDEEREDEKERSSKGQSSSNSFKINNIASGWDDWQQLIDMAKPENGRQHSNGSAEPKI